jgi:hypothetical protein
MGDGRLAVMTTPVRRVDAHMGYGGICNADWRGGTGGHRRCPPTMYFRCWCICLLFTLMISLAFCQSSYFTAHGHPGDRQSRPATTARRLLIDSCLSTPLLSPRSLCVSRF